MKENCGSGTSCYDTLATMSELLRDANDKDERRWIEQRKRGRTMRRTKHDKNYVNDELRKSRDDGLIIDKLRRHKLRRRRRNDEATTTQHEG